MTAPRTGRAFGTSVCTTRLHMDPNDGNVVDLDADDKPARVPTLEDVHTEMVELRGEMGAVRTRIVGLHLRVFPHHIGGARAGPRIASGDEQRNGRDCACYHSIPRHRGSAVSSDTCRWCRCSGSRRRDAWRRPPCCDLSRSDSGHGCSPLFAASSPCSRRRLPCVRRRSRSVFRTACWCCLCHHRPRVAER